MERRTKRFAAGLITGYATIIINVLYTFVSVRLAFKFLGEDGFGLWALAQQIAGYLMLLDLGMPIAVSRFVADHKDDVNGGEYGSLLLTGAIVFAAQGALIALAGAGFSFVAPALFAVPAEMQQNFRNVLLIITSLGGVAVALRSVGAPLWAFHRVDVANLLAIVTLGTSLAALWIGFRLGWGIYSFAVAGIPALIICPAITLFVCWRNGYYPARGGWGKPSWAIFRRVFGFGRDFVLLTLGSQLVNASQIMILSRVAGLGAVGTFAVGIKFFAMGQQFVAKIIESSAPALTEILVRGDLTRFNLRFWNAIGITVFLATLGACGLVVGNRAVVQIWTSGATQWSLPEDALLAGLIIATSMTRCLIGIFGLAGNFRPVRYIYFFEGCAFIAAAIPAARYFGIPGVLAVSLLTHVLVTGTLSVRSSARVLATVRPIIHYAVTSIAITAGALAVSTCLTAFGIGPVSVIVATPLVVSLAAVLGWYFILSSELRTELLAKFHQFSASMKNLAVARG